MRGTIPATLHPRSNSLVNKNAKDAIPDQRECEHSKNWQPGVVGWPDRERRSRTLRQIEHRNVGIFASSPSAL